MQGAKRAFPERLHPLSPFTSSVAMFLVTLVQQFTRELTLHNWAQPPLFSSDEALSDGILHRIVDSGTVPVMNESEQHNFETADHETFDGPEPIERSSTTDSASLLLLVVDFICGAYGNQQDLSLVVRVLTIQS
jgi:hypothetical protein